MSLETIRKLIITDKLDQALNSAKRLTSKHDFISLLALIGRGYVYRGDYDQAKSTLERGLILSKELDFKGELVEILSYLAYNEVNIGEMPRAYEMLLEGLEIAQKHKLLNKEEIALNILGYYYFMDGNYDKSFEYNKASNVIAEKLGNAENIAWNNYNMAKIFYIESNYHKALQRFITCYETFKGLQHIPGISISLYQLVLVQLKIKDTNGAERYLSYLQDLDTTYDLNSNTVAYIKLREQLACALIFKERE